MNKLCIGAGFVALDVLENYSDTLQVFCGGSVGNVCSILAYYEWDTFPIGRLGGDHASDLLLQDLKKLGVRTKYLNIEKRDITPVVVQKNYENNGTPYHRFEFFSMGKKIRFPTLKLPLLKSVEGIITSLDSIPYCFYFDRINPAILKLVKHFKAHGSIIFFEPSRISNDPKFLEAASFSNIIKYSRGSSGGYSQIFKKPLASLEIETMGGAGFHYRSKGDWVNVNPVLIKDVIDTSGAGDWFTANLILRAYQVGFDELINSNFLTESLFKVQLDSAENCLYYGAKGLLYARQKSTSNKPITISREVFGQLTGITTKLSQKPNS